MAGFTEIALAKLKRAFDSLSPRLVSPLPQPPSILDQANTNTANIKNNLVVRVGQSPVGQAIVNAQNFTQNNKPLEFKPFNDNTTLGKVGNFATSIPTAFVNVPVKTGVDVGNIIGRTATGQGLPQYNQLKSPLFRLAYNARGQSANPREVVGNAAGLANDVLTAYTPSAIENIGKNFVQNAGKETLKEALKRGFVQGSVSGGLFGTLGGLENNRGIQDKTYYSEVAKSIITGTVAGGVVGGGLAGAGNLYGQFRNKLAQTIQEKNPQIPTDQALIEADLMIRDERGRFLGKKPQFIKDSLITDEQRKAIRKEYGLPDKYNKGELNVDAFTKEVPNNLSNRQPEITQGLDQVNQTQGKSTVQDQQTLDDIIEEGRKQIGSTVQDKPTVSMKQKFNDIYTQWVDRYDPLVRASREAKGKLKSQQAMLRPENDPEYLVRRLTGAGGIADARFQKELKPVLDQVDSLKINKLDLDTYLANKRIAGFGEVGRDIYGADPGKAKQIVGALETKYGDSIKGIADQLYKYQDDGFKELIDAGFISPEVGQQIKSQNPDYAPLKRVMTEVSDYLGLPTRKTMQGSQPITKIKGSTKQIESPIESIIGNTFSQRAAIEKNRVAKSIVGLQGITDLGFQQVKESGPSTITVWSNGKKQFWDVGKEIADVAKGANEESMNIVLKIIQTPAALLRQGATGRNPEFMIPNVVRDQLDAGVTSKYGYVPFVDYAKGLFEIAKKDVNEKFGTNFDTSIYDKWANSGANIDLGELSGKKSISKLFTEKTAKKGLSDWLSSGIDALGRYSEQPTRVGLFKNAYQKTGNDLIAMMESRDATVDFARMGSKMKVANSIIPFLNVGVQGFDKLIRSIKDRPGQVLFTAGIYGAAPAIATTLYNLMNHPKEYSEIPQYEKDGNFVLVKGRNEKGTVDYVTIPKGNIIPTIANPIQSFLEYAYGNSQQTFQQMATTLISDLLPVVSSGSTVKEVALKSIGSNIPQAFKPATEVLLNKSFYKYDSNKQQSRDIVPQYLKNRPAYEQSYEYTPVMYKKIGALLNVSPLQVQSLMEGYLAGYTKIPAQIIDMATKVSRGEEINPNDKTIFRRFLKQTYESNAPQTQPTIETPGIMERLFGKTQAAEPTAPTDIKSSEELYKDAKSKVKSLENKLLTLPYEPRDKYKEYSRKQDIEKAQKELDQWKKVVNDYEQKNAGNEDVIRNKLKSSDLPYITTGNKLLYKTESGSIQEIQLNYQPKELKRTGEKIIDSKLIAKYKSELTSRQNDVIKLWELGIIDQGEMMTQINKLEELKKPKSGVGGAKKTKKAQVPHFTIPKSNFRAKAYKPKKVAPLKSTSLRSKPVKKINFRNKL